MINLAIARKTLRSHEPYLALLMFFSFFKLLGYMQVTYSPMINRVTYVNIPFNGTILSTSADVILMISFFYMALFFHLRHSAKNRIILLSFASLSVGLILSNVVDSGMIAIILLPVLIVIMIFATIKPTLLPHKRTDLVLLFSCFALIVGALEALALTGWIFELIAGDNDTTALLTDPERRFFFALNTTSPILALIILSSFASKFLISQISARFAAIQTKILHMRTLAATESNYSQNGWQIAAILAIISAFSVSIAYFPHIANENGNSLSLGTDNFFYFRWLTELQSDSPSFAHIISKAFLEINRGDRPLTLLLLYSFHIMFSSTLEFTVLYFPLFLSAVLPLAAFTFVLGGTGNRNLALLCALLSGISYPSVVGIYAGFLANWLALITSLMALTFLLRISRNPTTPFSYLGYGGFTMLTLLAHSYTGGFLIASSIAFLALSSIGNKLRVNSSNDLNIRKFTAIVLVLVIIIVMDVVKTQFAGIHGGVEGLNELVERTTGSGIFAERWYNLSYTFNIYVGSLLGNPFILLPAAIWALFARFSSNFDRLLLSQIAISIIPVLFGNYIAQTRIFYDLFLYIASSVVIYNVYLHRKEHPATVVIAAALVIALANYAIRSLSNLNLVVPEGA